MSTKKDIDYLRLKQFLGVLDDARKGKNINHFILAISSFHNYFTFTQPHLALNEKQIGECHEIFYNKLNSLLGGDWNYKIPAI